MKLNYIFVYIVFLYIKGEVSAKRILDTIQSSITVADEEKTIEDFNYELPVDETMNEKIPK